MSRPRLQRSTLAPLAVLLAALFLCGRPTALRAEFKADEFKPYFIAQQEYIVFTAKNIKSLALAKIKAGDAVFIIPGGGPTESVNGVHGSWEHVALGPDDQAMTGYIFGDVFLQNDRLLHDNIHFMYERKIDEKHEVAEIIIKALDQDGRLLAASEPVTALSLAEPLFLTPLDDRGLFDVEYILRLLISVDAGGYPESAFYYAWTGTEFVSLPAAMGRGDVGIDTAYNEELIFPRDGAPGNTIIKTITATDYVYDDNDEMPISTSERYAAQFYLWDGKRAVPQALSTPNQDMFHWFEEFTAEWYSWELGAN